jgi:phage gp29-like protein
MKTLKLFGIPVAKFGEEARPKPAPTTQSNFLSPRYEPSNITQNATVMQVQEAIRQAENGNTQELFRFYRDVLLSDDHIQSEVNTRKLAMLAQPMAILPADKKNPDDVKLAAALMQAKEDCENWSDGMIALLGSHCGWPVSVVERLYKPAGEPRPGMPALQFTLNKFVPVNPQLLCYQWAYMMGGVGLGTASAIQLSNMPGANGLGNSYTIDLEKWEPYIKLWPTDGAGRIIYDVTNAQSLDPARHIAHRGHLLTEFRDNWGGPMRAVLMWWLFRGLGRQWFANGMERYATPFPVAYTDINDPAQVQLLREAFDFAKKIGGLVVSENSRVELVQAMVQGMAQGYEAFFKLCNDAISKLITGLDSGSKPAGLNAGQGNIVLSVREDVRMFDQVRMSESLVKQLAIPFRDLNGLGNGRVKFAWGGLSDTDAQTFATMLQTMKNAGFELSDESIPIANERTGLSWQRAAAPEMGDGSSQFGGGTKNFSAGRLIRTLSVNSRAALLDPMDEIVKQRITTLSAAYRGAMAPIRTAIQESNSKEDCLKRLEKIFPDWSPTRLNAEINDALQLCAASGAAAAVKAN